ncbi:MAG TPA: CBS domain-containing protein, partial [Burkholderiaceae bacterium]|nr:CBS domain-containing protein [Burkholderiaceae bacterium]
MAATIGSTVQDLATPAVVVAEPDTLVLKAAQLMREHHVGALVVVDTTSGESRPVGIVTDRDLVLGVMAEGLDPAVFTVGDLMSTDLETIGPQAPLADAVSR